MNPLKAFNSALAQMPRKVRDKMSGKQPDVQAKPHVAWTVAPRCPRCCADLHPIWDNMDINCPRCLALIHVDREETARYRSTLV